MQFLDNGDKIGRKEFVEKIVSCADYLAEDQTVCIAIDGEWGSGKSFVMGKLYEKFNENDSYLTVRYDAWECSYYEEPLIAIFSSILDCAREKLSMLHGGKKALKAVGKEVGRDALELLSKKTGKIGNLAAFIKGFLKYLDIYQNGVALDTSDGRANEFRSYQSYLKEVQKSLNEFTAFRDRQGRRNKLIVLVDELDRCLPDMQLKILERLHHLFDVKNCVVVCAIHAGRVAENMRATYGVDGNEYLRKFFDLTYKLEKFTKVYSQRLFQDLIVLTQKMMKHADNAAEPIDLAYFLLSNGDDPILFRLDNRELTRYYSTIVSACNGFGWDKLSSKHMFTIIMGLFINRYCFTKFLAEDDVLKKNSKKIYFNGMRYEIHDYLGEYFGVDEEKLFTDQQRSYAALIPFYAETLNEMPFLAVFRSRNGDETGETDEYVRLRKLILLYGGDKNIDQSSS